MKTIIGLIIATLLTSCGRPSGNLAGTWLWVGDKTKNETWEFRADNAYVYQYPDHSESGTYKVEGDKLSAGAHDYRLSFDSEDELAITYYYSQDESLSLGSRRNFERVKE